MRLDSFFSGALCVLSGGRLPEALFMVFLLDSKGAIPKGAKASFPGLCASSGGRYPEALFMGFRFDSKQCCELWDDFARKHCEAIGKLAFS